ncbi:uncharacterized protein LOC100902590 [Galendromus occidentalis]|uniref:thioredoxin-dependent peroxiredoxin n=1 Tax=Galendromus occidentalis TaxID=34638 RepID=A0AAJ6QT09_9ACAR|nr:uncharacterized protein LOC100902590 [Galendromus occidentalis]
MFSAGVTEVSIPAEGEVVENSDKSVEQNMTTIVEHADSNVYAEWVTSNNFLRAGQELIVIHRPAVSNGNSNWPLRSNSVASAQDQEESMQNQSLTLLQANSKRKKDDEPGKKKRWYRQKFCDSWLSDERFKDWIGKVSDDVYKVYCRFCKVELRAGCSELLKHLKTKYHIDATNQDRSSPKELCYIVEQQVEEHQVDIEPGSVDSSQQIEHFSIQEQKFDSVGDGQGVEQICEANEVRRVQILRPIPAFRTPAIVDGVLKEISLLDYLGRFVLLTFYITDFEHSSINLVQELILLQSEFEKHNCVLLAASGDSVVTHKAWISSISDNGPKFPIPLIGDYNKSVAKSFGVYDEESGCAIPSTFLIDPKGRLRHMTVNDLSVTVSPGQLENCLKNLKVIDSKKIESPLIC